jgi:exopolysaccharide biosynthesis polyprenyl glycosylphosphotransferase
MTTPDYLQQIVISGRQRRLNASASGAAGTLSQPGLTSIVWASFDFLSALLGGLIAFRLRLIPEGRVPDDRVLAHLVPVEPAVALMFLFLFGAYLVIFARIYGLYGMAQNHSGLHEQRMTLQATLTAGLLLCGSLYVMHGYGISRVMVMLTVVLTMVMVMVRRAIMRKLRQRRYLQGLETRNILIVGDGRVGHALRNHLETLRHMGFRFMGFISLMPRRDDQAAPDVIGDVRDCVALARSLFVDEIYFSTPADKQTVVAVVEEARSQGIDVRVIPDLYDGLAWNARVEYIGQFPTIPLHRREFPRGAFLLKRILDVVLSLIVLLLVSPLMIAIATAVRFGSKGPIFYRAQRIGRKGRTFTCYKFRTMVVDADRLRKDLDHLNERAGVLFKISNDPRITKIGAMLRKYSLDELPQLFNVLIGDMSLVGPRPPIASEVEQYDIAHLRRLDVLPGITGLWQVEARQDPSFDSYISLDTAYVENWTLLLDLRILARTIGVVVGGTGS